MRRGWSNMRAVPAQIAATGIALDRDPSGIAEAIELPGHAFLVGLQGHPELGRGAALDRLWDAFLIAAAAQASRF